MHYTSEMCNEGNFILEEQHWLVEGLSLKSNNYTIKQYIKKRIICSIIDFILFAFLLGISFGFILSVVQNSYVLIYPIGFFLFYYIGIPYLTQGYTLMGFICGLRVIKSNNEKMFFIDYIKRVIFGMFSIFYFLGYIRVVVYDNGLMYYDVLSNSKVVLNELEVNFKSKKQFIFYCWFE